MKRRTLLQGLGAGSLLYLGHARGFSDSGTGTGTAMIRPLVPVFDRLPQSVATRAGLSLATATPDQLAMASSAMFDATAIGCGVWPLVIGLGKTAERIVDQIPAQFPELFPEWFGLGHLNDGAGDLGLYRTGLAHGAITATGLDLRLAGCAGAVLILDATDPIARAEATHWAGRLAAAEVYLRVLVVLNASGIRHDDPWRAGLQAPVIEVQPGADTLDQTGIVHALLPGLLMLQPNTGHDFADTKCPLTQTSYARTTAVRWTPSDDLDSVIANAYAAVSPHRCRDAHIWINASPSFSSWNEVNAQRFGEGLPDDVHYWVVPWWCLNMSAVELVFSVTLMYD